MCSARGIGQLRRSDTGRQRAAGLLAAATGMAILAAPARAQPILPVTEPHAPSLRARALSWYERLEPTLLASVSVRPVTLTIDALRRGRETGGIGEFGVRLNPMAALCGPQPRQSCRIVSRLTLEPHVSLGATHLRGIAARAGESSFATFEILGIRAAYAVNRYLVPQLLYRRGTHTSEQFEGGDVINLWGPGSTRGIGLLVPLTTLRRGITVSISEHRGSFENVERRNQVTNEKVISTTRRPFTARSWQVGWSGPFTGVTWPWQ
ncbi:MAG: hypothetical protein U5K74_02550 [Gemmatimonadaceae bacterium]|nr:hypothetical protein [Gemmatimonadaceae bacterium]